MIKIYQNGNKHINIETIPVLLVGNEQTSKKEMDYYELLWIIMEYFLIETDHIY